MKKIFKNIIWESSSDTKLTIDNSFKNVKNVEFGKINNVLIFVLYKNQKDHPSGIDYHLYSYLPTGFKNWQHSSVDELKKLATNVIQQFVCTFLESDFVKNYIGEPEKISPDKLIL